MNPLLAAILGPVIGLFDKLIPDPRERAKMQLQVMTLAQNGQLADLQAQVSIILAESNGNWLQRSWRPAMMVFFCGLIGARWFGYSAPGITPEEMLKLWDIVQLGIGGYTIGRTGEKVIPQIIEAMKK